MDKKQKIAYAKSVDSEKGTVTGHVSTYEWDRDGERFVKGSWDLNSYMKNPVVLWSHNPSIPPIGKNVDLKEDEVGLLATTEFDRKSDLGGQVFSLFERGFLNAFSVGFLRKSFVLEDNGAQGKGVAITGAELFEYSAVSVPANPGALVGRDIAEIAMKAIGPRVIEKITTKSLGDQYLVVPEVQSQERGAGANGEGGEPPTDLEPALKHVISMAKAARGGKLSDQKRQLLLTAISVFNETINENPEDVNPEDMIKLKNIFVEFAGVTASMYPALSETVQRTISQIDKALTGREG